MIRRLDGDDETPKIGSPKIDHQRRLRYINVELKKKWLGFMHNSTWLSHLCLRGSHNLYVNFHSVLLPPWLRELGLKSILSMRWSFASRLGHSVLGRLLTKIIQTSKTNYSRIFNGAFDRTARNTIERSKIQWRQRKLTTWSDSRSFNDQASSNDARNVQRQSTIQ